MPEALEVKSEEEEEDPGKVVVEELEDEMAEVGAVFEVEIPKEEDRRKVFEAAEAGALMTVHGVEAEKVAEVAEVEAEKAGLATKKTH
jgi:hypothetical protein